MLVAKCIEKIRDKNGKIVKYRLQDKTGSQTELEAKLVKKFIMESQMDIVNLQVTADGRLVDKTEDNSQYKSTEEKEQYLNTVANKVIEFILPILKEFPDARSEKIELTSNDGKLAYLSSEEKSLKIIREIIRQERLSAIKIVVYNYEGRLAGNNEDDNYEDDSYDDSEEQEQYLRELYGSYDSNGYSAREEMDSRDSGGYGIDTYRIKLEAQEAKDKIEKFIGNFEAKNSCKVIYRLTSIKREGELAIIFRGFR